MRCLGAAWKQVEQPGAALFSLFALPGSRVKDVLSRIKWLELHLISGFRCLEVAASLIRAAWQAGVYLFRATWQPRCGFEPPGNHIERLAA